jgi:hypothetical protein
MVVGEKQVALASSWTEEKGASLKAMRSARSTTIGRLISGAFPGGVAETRQTTVLSDGRVANRVLAEHPIAFITDFLGCLALVAEEQPDGLQIHVQIR